MEIVGLSSVRGSGLTAVHVSVHVDGQAQAWVNTYPDFVTVEICQRSAAVTVFVQNVDQADELIELFLIARTELAAIGTVASSTQPDVTDQAIAAGPVGSVRSSSTGVGT